MNTQKSAATNGANPQPETSDTLILPDGLRDWIADNADNAIEILDYLRRHPLELLSIATIARLEVDGPALLFTPDNPRAAELYEHRERLARQWLDSGKLGACPRCVSPVLFFGDGRFLDVKPAEHVCGARHAA